MYVQKEQSITRSNEMVWWTWNINATNNSDRLWILELWLVYLLFCVCDIQTPQRVKQVHNQRKQRVVNAVRTLTHTHSQSNSSLFVSTHRQCRIRHAHKHTPPALLCMNTVQCVYDVLCERHIAPRYNASVCLCEKRIKSKQNKTQCLFTYWVGISP